MKDQRPIIVRIIGPKTRLQLQQNLLTKTKNNTGNGSSRYFSVTIIETNANKKKQLQNGNWNGTNFNSHYIGYKEEKVLWTKVHSPKLNVFTTGFYFASWLSFTELDSMYRFCSITSNNSNYQTIVQTANKTESGRSGQYKPQFSVSTQ